MNGFFNLRLVLFFVTFLLVCYWTLRGSNNKIVSDARQKQVWTVSRPEQQKVECSELRNMHIENLTPKNIELCEQTSPILWEYIRRHHVTPPSGLPFNYTMAQVDMGEVLPRLWPIIELQTRTKKIKIFVEAGANDGMAASNTIWLEHHHGWTGVLIECHPELVPKIYALHRKAYVVDVCLSQTKFPSTVTLKSVDGWSGSSSLGRGNIFPDWAKNFTDYKVQSMPLYAVLAALEIREIDYFSLDIQSFELHVLRTFPFDQVHVKVWSIEVILLPETDQKELIQLMKNNDYMVSNILARGNQDLIFIKNRK